MGKRKNRDETDEDLTIKVDGAQLEGGGQVLRNCISFAALMKVPVHISRIRGGRKRPGIKNQHLLGIQLVTHLFQGELKGASVGSNECLYIPNGQIHREQQEYTVVAPTAASTMLILQTSLPCAIFLDRPIRITYGGGTNASYAPQVDYTIAVFQTMLSRCGINFEIECKRRGFFPKGCGEVTLTTKPVDYIKPFELTNFGNIKTCVVKSLIGKLEMHVAERQARACGAILQSNLPEGVEIQYELDDVGDNTESAGCGCFAFLETDTGIVFGGSGLGAPRKRAEKVGEEAALEIVECIRHKICVDQHFQDQIIQFMALAKGESKILTGPITMHTKTAIHFSQVMTGARFQVQEVDENRNLIICEGIGYINRHYDDI